MIDHKKHIQAYCTYLSDHTWLSVEQRVVATEALKNGKSGKTYSLARSRMVKAQEKKFKNDKEDKR